MRRKDVIATAGRTLLVYALIVSILPLNPWMPVRGAESSWRVAVNRAAAEHLVFGRDFVFTYGPYGGVLTRTYEPGIHLIVSLAATALAAGYVTAALIALRDARPAVLISAGSALILLASSDLDGLAMLYPLAMVCALGRLRWQGAVRLLAIAVLAIPLGLLPLTKASVLPVVIAGIAVGVVLLLHRRDRLGALLLLATTGLSLAGWWVAVGQPVSGLASYLRSSWQMISGYSEAMSLHDSSRLAAGSVTLLYLGLALCVVAATTTRAWGKPDELIVCGMTVFTLFLVFKSGFVRSDSHMQLSVPALVLTTILPTGHVRNAERPRLRVPTGVAVAGTVLCYLATTLTSPTVSLRASTVDVVAAVVRGDLRPAILHRQYDASMTRLRTEVPLAESGGATDLYPSALVDLLARDVPWAPRPIVQSYAAYTPALAERNARHLTSPGAPESVFFRIDPIDNRLPALEDGATWMPLVRGYQLVGRSAGYLQLRRREVQRPVQIGELSQTTRLRLGQRFDLPDADTGWLATFNVRPSMLGDVREALWKQPELRIEVTTADGETHVRRFIPAMAATEFLLSPYVGRTKDFAALFAQGPAPGSATNRVASICVRLEDPGWPAASASWRSTYTLKLRSVRLQP